MSNTTEPTQPAIKYDAVVQPNGQIALVVPFAPGKRVVVFVIQATDDAESFHELTDAAASNLAFWDNPWDDEDWNNA